MSSILLAHIILACLTLLLGILAWSSTRHISLFWFRASYLSSLLSGIFLFFSDPLTLGVCLKLAIYLPLIAITEYRLARLRI